MSVAPYSAQGFSVIAALRQDLARAAPGALTGGSPAAEYDITQAAGRDTAVIIPLALLVILLVIAALLRAVTAALVLTATTALSFGASLGLAALLWRYGFGYPGIYPQIPLSLPRPFIRVGGQRPAGDRQGHGPGGLGAEAANLPPDAVTLAAVFTDTGDDTGQAPPGFTGLPGGYASCGSPALSNRSISDGRFAYRVRSLRTRAVNAGMSSSRRAITCRSRRSCVAWSYSFGLENMVSLSTCCHVSSLRPASFSRWRS